jgi:hypothetical protein
LSDEKPKKERKRRASNWLGEVQAAAKDGEVILQLLRNVKDQREAKRIVDENGREGIEYRYVTVYDDVIVKEAPPVPKVTTRVRSSPLA